MFTFILTSGWKLPVESQRSQWSLWKEKKLSPLRKEWRKKLVKGGEGEGEEGEKIKRWSREQRGGDEVEWKPYREWNYSSRREHGSQVVNKQLDSTTFHCTLHVMQESTRLQSMRFRLWECSATAQWLVSSPDQIFHAHPTNSSKKSFWQGCRAHAKDLVSGDWFPVLSGFS